MAHEYFSALHLRNAVQVIRARHEDVVTAELGLRARHRSKMRTRRRGMATSFDTGTEVVPASTRINLTEWLHGDDVTHQFDLGGLE